MALVRNEMTWGATRQAPPPPAHDVLEWTVEVESEAVDELVLGLALLRFAQDAAQRAPEASPEATLTDGRFGLSLTIAATTADEAAREGGRVFAGALETALWPHAERAAETRYDVRVAQPQLISTAA
jgi:hypothetical protein